MSITSVKNDNVGDSSFINAQKSIPPTITGYTVSGSDDTALDPAGGQTVLINGTGFQRGATITFDGNAVAVVTWVSSNQLSFTSPAKSAGTYTMYVVNADSGTAIYIPGIIYSNLPTWTTGAGSLGSYYETTSISNTVVASGDAPITYSLVSGSLPTGATLYANGVITGTAPVDTGSTTYSFTVEAIDAQLQNSTRSFSLTINTDVVTWSNPSNGATINLDGAAYSNVLSATSAAGYGISSYTANALPTGLTLSGNTISGTPTVVGSTTTLLTATASTTGRSATNTVTWVVTLGDTYWSYVTTLLSPALSALPFNDDASTNNFAVTAYGDTKPNNFNPYTPGYYSNYFDGSSYIQVTNGTNLAFSTDNFTIECYAYFPTGSLNAGVINGLVGMFNGTSGPALYTSANLLYWGNDGAYITDAGTTLSTNKWIHIAISRQSSTTRMFVDGVQTTSFADTRNYTCPTGYPMIGRAVGFGYMTGNLSNVRILKGTALYTSTFTPSASPITPTGAATEIVTCQSNRLIDTAPTGYALTMTGAVTVRSFIPYIPNLSYSTYGSTYFDGTSDFLGIPTGSSAFDFSSTKTMTLEFWAYVTTWGGTYSCFFDIQEGAPFRFTYFNGTLYWQTAAGNVITAAVTLSTNTWYHYAFVRNNDTVYMFVNGVGVATGSYTAGWGTTAAGNVFIGCNRGDTWFVNGYMTDVRLVKGTALYTSAFTPPTQPLTAITNTSLLTCQTNQSVNNNLFLDSSTNNLVVTRNGNTTQGTFSPYGENWSYYFDGASDYFIIGNSAPFTFGTGDFTVETWIYLLANQTGYILDTRPSTTQGAYFTLYYSSNTRFVFQTGTSSSISGTPGTYTNAWVHVAVCKASGITKLFINGIQQGGSYTDTTSYTSATLVTIGASSYTLGAAGVYGYISNLRVVKGTALYTSNFTPSTTPLQPITKTSLLTCKDSNIVDDSPNNLTLTRNGDISVQKFGPFAGTTLPTPYYSAYFDGTGDYLTVNGNSNLALGTGDFTIEGWFYATTSSGWRSLANIGNTTDTGVYLSSGNVLNWYEGGIKAPSAVVTANVWNHFAVTKQGTTLRVFLNGVKSDSDFATVTDYTRTSVNIGANGAFGELFTGYLSNIRVVKGTALYTTNFTPPTSPLTAISGTSLLTCQSNRLIDNSTNNFAITANGNSRPTTFNPFTVSYSTRQSYTPAVYGGSMYVDGGSDWLSVPGAGTALSLTSDFTVEFWVYPIGLVSNNYYHLVSAGYNVSVLKVHWYPTVAAGGGTFYYYNAPNSYNYEHSSTMQNLVWSHVAWVRSGSTSKLYINGISTVSVTTLTETIGWNSNFYVASGGTSNENFPGYISDIRIVNGMALYTSNFVPENKPCTPVKNTTLLVSGTSAGIYDSSLNAEFETVGDAKLSTSTVKFSGTTSIYLDGTGDYLAAPPPPSCMSGELGTGDFTIEYWMNASAAGTYATVVGTQSIAGNSTAGIWRASNRFNGANGIYFNYTNGGSFIDLTFSTTNYNDGAWHHVAFVRSSGTLKAYVDGTQVGSAQSVTQSLSSNQRMYVGYNVQDNVYYTGYISDLRITKGIARYTTNFTPPTSAFKAS